MTKDELASVARTLGVMFQCFPQSALADPDLQVRGYIAAVEGFDAEDILSACGRFIRGEALDHNRSFCPSTAQLCAEIRERRNWRVKVESRATQLKLVPVLPDNHFSRKWDQLQADRAAEAQEG